MAINKALKKPMNNPNYEKRKASNLCFEAVYGEKEAKFKKQRINDNYFYFRKYLNLAFAAANLKKSIEAQYFLVDRNNDYRLSTWITIKVLTKTLNGKQISYDENKYESLLSDGFELETIPASKITVDGKESVFFQIDDFYVVEGLTTSKIVVNDDPTISLSKDVYNPQHVINNGNVYEVRKNKVSIDVVEGDFCEDAQFPFLLVYAKRISGV